MLFPAFREFRQSWGIGMVSPEFGDCFELRTLVGACKLSWTALRSP